MMKKIRTRTKSASEGSEFGRKLVNANNLRRRVDLSGLSKKEREAFYAGAKFDTVPENAVIPVPPIKWIMQEGTRSLSSPSSPITVSGKPANLSLNPSPSLPIKLDIESLFGTKRPASTDFGDTKLGRLLKSASVPEREMELYHQPLDDGISSSVNKSKSNSTSEGIVSPGVKKPIVVAQQATRSQSIVHPQVAPTSNSAELMKVSGISGKDLMGLLKLEPTHHQVNSHERQRPSSVSSSCHFEYNHSDSVDSQYKDITNHLKSILKVSITVA